MRFRPPAGFSKLVVLNDDETYTGFEGCTVQYAPAHLGDYDLDDAVRFGELEAELLLAFSDLELCAEEIMNELGPQASAQGVLDELVERLEARLTRSSEA